MSVTFDACRAQGHVPSRYSPDGVDIVLECADCCRAWIQKPSGEIIRLFGTAERRLVEQKMAREAKPSAPGSPPRPTME